MPGCPQGVGGHWGYLPPTLSLKHVFWGSFLGFEYPLRFSWVFQFSSVQIMTLEFSSWLLVTGTFTTCHTSRSRWQTCRLFLRSSINKVAPTKPSEHPPHREVTGEMNQTGGDQQLFILFLLKIFFLTLNSGHRLFIVHWWTDIFVLFVLPTPTEVFVRSCAAIECQLLSKLWIK